MESQCSLFVFRRIRMYIQSCPALTKMNHNNNGNNVVHIWYISQTHVFMTNRICLCETCFFFFLWEEGKWIKVSFHIFNVKHVQGPLCCSHKVKIHFTYTCFWFSRANHSLPWISRGRENTHVHFSTLHLCGRLWVLSALAVQWFTVAWEHCRWPCCLRLWGCPEFHIACVVLLLFLFSLSRLIILHVIPELSVILASVSVSVYWMSSV